MALYVNTCKSFLAFSQNLGAFTVSNIVLGKSLMSSGEGDGDQALQKRDLPPKKGHVPCTNWKLDSAVFLDKVQGNVSLTPPRVYLKGSGKFWKCSGSQNSFGFKKMKRENQRNKQNNALEFGVKVCILLRAIILVTSTLKQKNLGQRVVL